MYRAYVYFGRVAIGAKGRYLDHAFVSIERILV